MEPQYSNGKSCIFPWHLPGKMNGKWGFVYCYVSLPEGSFSASTCFAFLAQSLGKMLQFHEHMFYSWGGSKGLSTKGCMLSVISGEVFP